MKQTQLNLWSVDHDVRLFCSHPVKKSILEFLGNHPRHLLVHGPQGAGDLSLALGKLLVWIAKQYDDDHGPNFRAPVASGERAASIWALGEQFKEVGLKLIDHSPTALEARVIYLQKSLGDLEKQFHAIFRGVVSPLTPAPICVPDWMRTRDDKGRHQTDLFHYRAGIGHSFQEGL
ncbi:MAG TPA: hypothetical protein VH280_25735 [Verrucomicrobiae bacterium]|jgi:hypothetical protein|nr:hypothetical protein [Verrucomicrobiae bacterium]